MAAAVVLGAALGVVLHTLGVGAADGTGVGVGTAEVAGARVERELDVPVEAIAAGQVGVLWVEAGGCGEVRQASATVVSSGSETLVLTNAHVVKGAGTVSLRAPSGRAVTAQVLGTVPNRDAAVLRVSEDERELVEGLPVASRPAVGDAVSVVGHPDGHTAALRGNVASIERRAGFGGSSDVLVVDAPVRGGNSGGAVLDDEGRVVGLVAAKDPRTGWAVAYPIAEVLGRGLGPIPSC